MRWFRHIAAGASARWRFTPETLGAIQHAIAKQEQGHFGEICVAVEGRLHLAELVRGRTPGDRAREVFANLRVWDTVHRTGVLIYLLLADRAIEIVADRAVAAKVNQGEWDAICRLMQDGFRAGNYQAGAIAGIDAVAAVLRRYFPSDDRPNPDELPDRPVML